MSIRCWRYATSSVVTAGTRPGPRLSAPSASKSGTGAPSAVTKVGYQPSLRRRLVCCLLTSPGHPWRRRMPSGHSAPRARHYSLPCPLNPGDLLPIILGGVCPSDEHVSSQLARSPTQNHEPHPSRQSTLTAVQKAATITIGHGHALPSGQSGGETALSSPRIRTSTIGTEDGETRTAESIVADLLDFARTWSADREPVAAAELARGASRHRRGRHWRGHRPRKPGPLL